MKTKENYSKQVTIRISEKVFDSLEAKAEEEGVNVSTFIRKSIEKNFFATKAAADGAIDWLEVVEEIRKIEPNLVLDGIFAVANKSKQKTPQSKKQEQIEM